MADHERGEWWRRVSFERRLAAGGALVLALLALATSLIWRSARDLKAALDRVALTHVTMQAIEEVLRLNADAELSTRGFVISDRDEFLMPHRAASSPRPSRPPGTRNGRCARAGSGSTSRSTPRRSGNGS